MSSRDETQTTGEMLWEILDLMAGLGVMLLPAMLLAIPCLVLLLPLVLPAIPLAILAAPYLLIRALLRRRPTVSPVAPSGDPLGAGAT